MAVKTVATEDEIFSAEPTTKVKVRSKVKATGSRLVLTEDTEDEDEDLEHSGVTLEDGTKIFDQSRVEGGRILSINPRTKKQTYVNAFNQEIDEETGKVLNPEKYENNFSGA